MEYTKTMIIKMGEEWEEYDGHKLDLPADAELNDNTSTTGYYSDEHYNYWYVQPLRFDENDELIQEAGDILGYIRCH
jgi:hypothetical protein